MGPTGSDTASLRVLFVCSGRDRDSVSPVVSAQGDSIKREGVMTDYFPVGGKGWRSYLKAVGRLRRRLKKDKPDIIHAHYALSAFVALAARRSTPLVVSFMGDDILGTNRADGTLTFSSRLLSRVNSFFARWFYDYVIVKSEEMYQRLFQGTRVEVIPNGVDTGIFFPMDRAAAKQQAGFSDDIGNFLFIGDPARPEKNYSLAQEAATIDGLHNRLHIIRDKKPRELTVFYCAADAVIMTSFHEGSPNIIKEAMACNCPVVATDVGDVRQLSDGVEGHFITGYDRLEVAHHMAAASRFRSVSGATTGRRKIEAMRLDSVSVAKRIIDIYEMVSRRQKL